MANILVTLCFANLIQTTYSTYILYSIVQQLLLLMFYYPNLRITRKKRAILELYQSEMLCNWQLMNFAIYEENSHRLSLAVSSTQGVFSVEAVRLHFFARVYAPHVVKTVK